MHCKNCVADAHDRASVFCCFRYLLVRRIKNAKDMKIKIGKKNYNVKNTVRALFIFERITRKAFSIETILDNYIYLYSILLANNEDMDLTWDEFIDYIDKDPDFLNRFNKLVTKGSEVQDVFNKADDKEEVGEEKKD